MNILIYLINNLNSNNITSNKKFVINIIEYKTFNINKGIKRLNRKNRKIKQKNKNKNMTCSICIDDSNQKDIIYLKCNHCFHSKCLKKWFKEKISLLNCPLCRKNYKNIMPTKKKTKIKLLEYERN